MCDCTDKEQENGFIWPLSTSIQHGKNCGKSAIFGTDFVKESLHDIRQKNESDVRQLIFDETELSSTEYSSNSKLSSTFSKEDLYKCVIKGEDTDEHIECVCEDEKNENNEFQYTLVIIKPEVFEKNVKIESFMREEGFHIQQTKFVQLTPEQVSDFYAHNYESKDFTHFLTYMTSGPITVKILSRPDVVRKWRALMGPTEVCQAKLYFPDSFRARFGIIRALYENGVHGSTTRRQAEREIRFFFPDFVQDQTLKGDFENYLENDVADFLLKALSMCCRMKPFDPILWLANWLLLNNPNVPNQYYI